MAVISFVLEFLFLAVFGWGIWAAAFASSLAMMAGAAVSLYPFWRGYLQLKFCRPSFSAAMIANIFVCGCPIFLNNVSGRLTSIMMNFLLLRFGGTTAVSVYGVLMYADSFITQFLRLAACGWLQLGCWQFSAHQPDRALLLRNGGRRITYIGSGDDTVSA